jgi:hypothetical protein
MSAVAGVALAAPTFNTPIANSSQVDNALALSKKAFAGGAPAVVITTVDGYADSLSAAVLAKVYGGPLLVTSSSSLSASVATELTRLNPTKVFLVGLPASFVAGVKGAVPALTDPTQIVVLKGADRYETAALVAREIKGKLGSVSQVVVAPGDSYAAAVAASTLAAVKGWPLLLTPAAGPFPQVSADALAELGVDSGMVVGTGLTPPGFTVTKRITGTTSTSDPDGRFDLCAKVAEYASSQGWLSFAHVGLVPGDVYAAGEATAAFLALDKGVLLFSGTSGLPQATANALKTNAAKVSKVDFVGLGWPVFREVKSLNSPRVTGLSAAGGPVGGGNKLVVTGSALNGVTRVRVGKVDVPSSDWRIDSATQLTLLSVPAGYGPGPAEVIVSNFWGASPASPKDLYVYAYDGPVPNGYKVVQEAVKYLGVPYLWAGASPTTGFDCSGFAMYVYSKFGISLPHYSRSQATYGTAVAKEDLLPGDLVFFYTPISHVGVYVGGGLMINAPRSGDLVIIEDAFRSSYVTARRLISAHTRYEQTDANLAYSGTWSTGSSTSYSGGSFKYANSAGSAVTVTFTGTSLVWVAKKSPVYGKAKVTLDGGAPVTVDLYSASTLYQQKVWNSGTLASGTHTVRIEWTGLKNSAATNTNISVDAFDVVGTLTKASVTPPPPTATTTRYEQGDSKILYTGTWLPFSASGSSGGSYTYADSAATASIAFTGTRLDWIATTGYTQGKAKVSVDGAAAVTVDLYNATTLRQQRVWSTGALADGAHTVTISWTGERSVSTGGTRVNLDAVDVLGTLTQASATPPPPPPPTASTATRYEQDDPSLLYKGTWSLGSSTAASGGSHRYTETSGSSVTVTFTGTSLAWIAKKSPVYGKAKVTLDGGAPVTVDLYDAAVTWQQKVWETGTLGSGNHTVKIEWTGTKNSAATATNVSIDAFDVVGSLTSAAAAAQLAPTRYEQKDSRFAYEGGWMAVSATGATAGAYRRADVAGASVTVTFDGTYLAWVAAVSAKCGKAKVTLDGGTPVTVDLYSATTLYQQKVWETGNLAAGAHTVRIEWTGSKSPAAAGAAITVDAFDITGTVTQAPLPAAVRFEQPDPHLVYAGVWSTTSTSSASGGSFRYSNSSGSSVTVTFTGFSLAWIAKKSPVYGKAKVTLDGGAPVTVDLYSPGTLWQEKAWTTGDLTPGTHTVRIEWTGAKNSSATATNISIDAFDIRGSLN